MGMPDKNTINIHGDLNVEGDFVAGDKHETIIQKFFNIFKSDSETLEQRNRRILLNHVENAWIKGVLDASLHGAALLDLGIKQDTEAVTQYPWTLKKESTDETLPAGTSMLEIFDSIGMGRSLLILGAPGSGKTTMLLELARGLIARAREDITQSIPMVFNLASWTEKLTLADWLAQELNNLYSVPRKTAPDWVKGNKLLLLLDGLDEVRQESRAKCVEAINEFRKQNGLTSLAVCSRSQDYADLKTKLSFEGAIEVQPLTQEQITEFFNRFGDEMAGIKQALEKDSGLREMAETPLFLSIMLITYRDKQAMEILTLGDEKSRHKRLFDTYTEGIFKHPHVQYKIFEKQDVLNWLSWLAHKMTKQNHNPYFFEGMQPNWIEQTEYIYQYKYINRLFFSLTDMLFFGSALGLILGLIGNLILGLVLGLLLGLGVGLTSGGGSKAISTVDFMFWDWSNVRESLIVGLVGGSIFGLGVGLIFGASNGLIGGLIFGVIFSMRVGLRKKQVDQITHPGQRLAFTLKNFLFIFLFSGFSFGLIGGLINSGQPSGWLLLGLSGGLSSGLQFGGSTLIQHYALRFVLARNNLLPWRLVPFLDHCVNLIFLRRVGGGYIFIHRLLMEHFAEMYVESPTPKGN
jgi:hypothetical protein